MSNTLGKILFIAAILAFIITAISGGNLLMVFIFILIFVSFVALILALGTKTKYGWILVILPFVVLIIYLIIRGP